MKSMRSRNLIPMAFYLSVLAACSDTDTVSPELDTPESAAPSTPTAGTPPAGSPTQTMPDTIGFPVEDTTEWGSVLTPYPPTGVNPFAGASLFVDPASRAKTQADLWRATRPADAAELDKVAARSQADWYNEWATDIRYEVSRRVSTITNAGKLPVLVAYNIPKRDCGSYSAGGTETLDLYRAWIRAFARGIGLRKAVVILEPDALAGMGCLPAAEQTIYRTRLLRTAVRILKSNPNTFVYLDAGHSNWQSAATMASRLTAAGIAEADGFSLNISNFQFSSNTVAYGEAISKLVGGKRFIFDSSRNGLGPGTHWCNPDGRALGTSPSTNTGRALVDAVLWIKKPGESDGSCNGGPSSGAWWPEYAVGLAQRSGSSLLAGL